MDVSLTNQSRCSHYNSKSQANHPEMKVVVFNNSSLNNSVGPTAVGIAHYLLLRGKKVIIVIMLFTVAESP